MYLTMLALGWLAHHVSVLAEMSQAAGKRVTPLEYARRRPYKLTLSLIGTAVGYLVLMQMDELTLLTAFGAGFIADTTVDRAGKLAMGKMA